MKKIFLFFCLMLSVIIKAQDSTINTSDFCGYDKLYFPGGSANPAFTLMFNDMAASLSGTPAVASGTPYTIPVVVHVIHSGAFYGTIPNISYAQIQWQIAALNAAFNKDYPIYNGQTHGPLSEDVQIRFCLAANTTDNGMTPGTIPWTSPSEPGVKRYTVPSSSTVHQFDINNPVDYASLLGITHSTGTEFPYNMYLNIWIVQDICDTSPGAAGCSGSYSPVPSVVGMGTPFTTMGLDGIVFRANCFGDVTPPGLTPTSFPLFWGLTQGKILAHEVGHYLSLFHTFQGGCTSGPCATTGDECCDTPPSNSFTVLPCSPSPVISCPPNPDQVENYMSYSDDECMNTFTLDQTTRMDAWIVASRANLVSTANLAATGVLNIAMTNCSCCLLTANFNVSPTGIICPGTSIQFLTPSTGSLCANTWTWSFPGGSPSSFVGQIPPPILFSTAGTYTVTLTASDGTSSVTMPMTITVQAPTATITGQSEIDACNGSTQHLVVSFSGAPGPYNVQICDNTGAVVGIYNTLTQNPAYLSIPVSTTSNTFSLCVVSSATCPGLVGGGPVTFNIVECCSNLFINGDFQSATGCNILPSTTNLSVPGSGICNFYSMGFYGAWNPTTGSGTWPIIPGFPGTFGNSMYVDPPTPPLPFPLPIPHEKIWSQTVNLAAGADYSIQFNVTGEFGNFTVLAPPLFPSTPLVLQLMVDGAFIGTPFNTGGVTATNPWLIFTQNWTNTLGAGLHTIELCEIDNLFGSKDYLLDNISIRRMGIPTVTATPTTLTMCSGSSTSIVLTGSPAGVTFNWTAVVSGVTGASSGTWTGSLPFTIAQTLATVSGGTVVYTITPSLDGCIGTPVNATVTVTPVSIAATVTPGTTSFCSGGTTNIILSGTGTTFNWTAVASGVTGASSGTGTGSFTIAQTIATTSGGTVVYTITPSVGTCTGTPITVIITVNNCLCTVPTGNTVIPPAGAVSTSYPSGFSASPIAINGNFTVTTGTFTMNSINDVKIAPGVKIVVNSGATLIIDKCKLYTCSNEMWEGIEIKPGGNLIITNGVRIEDAKTAVLSDNITGTASFLIEQSTFNRNYIGIKVINYISTTILHPGIIRDCLFDSQPWAVTGSVSTLDVPYNTQTANIGVELNGVGKIQIGDPTSIQNRFRYLRIGIRSQASAYTAFNNDFRNNFPTPSCFGSPGGPPCPVIGWAIWNTKGKATIGGYGTNEPNNFKDLSNGIIHEGGEYLDVLNNTFTNITITPSSILSAAVFTTGFSQGSPSQIRIMDNDMKVLERGCYHLNNFTTKYIVQGNKFKDFSDRGVYAVQTNIGTIDILSNTFNEAASTSAYTGNIGIEVSNAVTLSSPAVTISSNSEYKINKGIAVTGIVQPRIELNVIAFKNSVVLPGFYYGIRTMKCTKEIISQNNIYKSVNPTSLYETSLYGISVETSASMATVTENTTQKMGQGIRFFNDATGDLAVRCNIMTLNWIGLGIDLSNIGSQGSSSPVDAADNNWSTIPSSMSGSRSAKGYGAYTPANFYTRAGAPIVGAYPWCPSNASVSPLGTVRTVATFPSPLVGGLVPTAPHSCPNICYTLPIPCPHVALAKIARNENPYNGVSGIDRYNMQESVMRAVLSDTIPPDTTTTDGYDLQYYVDTTLANTEVGKFITVSKMYSDGDTLGAQSLNAAASTKNCADEYHKIVNSIFFNTWAIGEFNLSASDYTTLYDIAIQNPAICGTAIYDARVMLSLDINDYTDESRMMEISNNNDIGAVEDKVGILYPNPASNSCTYEALLAESESGFILMYDLTGRLLHSYKLNSGENKVEMNLNEFDNGIYIYKILVNGNIVDNKKLVIQK